ncbi:MAG: hypothetical protein V1901_03840 [Patescibacteria group bacterium]
MNIKTFSNNYGEITALCRETNFLWIGYIASGLARLRKVSIFNPNLVYYDISISGIRINKIINSGDYIYLSIDSNINIGARFYKTNPIGLFIYYTKPAEIIENSIDLITDFNYVYFLIPGLLSGTNAKIVKHNKSTGAFVEIINLTTVNNAKKIDMDFYCNIWVVSGVSDIELIKVWYDMNWQNQKYIIS